MGRVQEYRKQHRERNHRRLRGYLLLALIAFFAGGSAILAFALSSPFSWGHAVALLAGLAYSNFVEYALHRWVLHYPFFLRKPYQVHTGIHHRFFTDQEMAYDEERDLFDILIPGYGVSGVLALAATASLIFGLFSSVSLGLCFFGACAGYYLVYELVHLGAHAKQDHWCRRIPLLARGMRLHQEHHNPRVMRKKNFNIVVPLCDILFRTMA